jgi:hypothetical protein
MPLYAPTQLNFSLRQLKLLPWSRNLAKLGEKNNTSMIFVSICLPTVNSFSFGFASHYNFKCPSILFPCHHQR